ncbi:hypothetical protein [Photorhabdus sp. SF281]|uniref:hypothetical protein n=1 Tax=Photorhabdus sp. SF281 TaxID=3459527 RepID=UPI004044AF67
MSFKVKASLYQSKAAHRPFFFVLHREDYPHIDLSIFIETNLARWIIISYSDVFANAQPIVKVNEQKSEQPVEQIFS